MFRQFQRVTQATPGTIISNQQNYIVHSITYQVKFCHSFLGFLFFCEFIKEIVLFVHCGIIINCLSFSLNVTTITFSLFWTCLHLIRWFFDWTVVIHVVNVFWFFFLKITGRFSKWVCFFKVDFFTQQISFSCWLEQSL